MCKTKINICAMCLLKTLDFLVERRYNSPNKSYYNLIPIEYPVRQRPKVHLPGPLLANSSQGEDAKL